MAVKKVTGTAVTKWDEVLAARAKIASKLQESALGLGNSISTRAGILAYRDNPIPGNKMNVIILDAAYLNTWYREGFDADGEGNVPDCFAIAAAGADPESAGQIEALMSPHGNSAEPQSDLCIDCPLGGKEAWGTADKGKGKACKNTRRLILVTEDALEDMQGAQPATIKVPTTSVKNYAGYSKSLDDNLHRPPFAVVTEISLVPDAKTQFKMQFKLVRKIEDKYLQAILDKVDGKGTQDQLTAPYQKADDEKQAPSAKAGAKARGNVPAKAPARGKAAPVKGRR